MHEAEHPRNHFANSFTYNQAVRITKGVICVQIVLDIHLTEHGRFHFQGRATCYSQQAHDVNMTSMQRDDVT